MKIASFTDHLHTPSSRFRMRQYVPDLKKAGIQVHDYYRKFSTETSVPANSKKRIRDSYLSIFKALLHESTNIVYRLRQTIASNQYDAVWLSRQLIVGYPSFEALIRRPLIYDIDDAIYLNGKLANFQFMASAKKAHAIVAGNAFLADVASEYCKKVHIIPTAVDISRWKPKPSNEQNINRGIEDFIIGWSGTSTSFKYFLPLEKTIKRFLLDFPSAKFLIMADRFPFELKELSPYIIFNCWTSENEVTFIQSLDVGLMPIADDMWSKGKCAYKSLLYSACGIPVIITPVGVNKDVLHQADIGFGPNNTTEWYDALKTLFTDRLLGKKLGNNGVGLVGKNYSLSACAPKIIKIFKNIV